VPGCCVQRSDARLAEVESGVLYLIPTTSRRAERNWYAHPTPRTALRKEIGVLQALPVLPRMLLHNRTQPHLLMPTTNNRTSLMFRAPPRAHETLTLQRTSLCNRPSSSRMR
jgi:hypothetical protein